MPHTSTETKYSNGVGAGKTITDHRLHIVAQMHNVTLPFQLCCNQIVCSVVSKRDEEAMQLVTAATEKPLNWFLVYSHILHTRTASMGCLEMNTLLQSAYIHPPIVPWHLQMQIIIHRRHNVETLFSRFSRTQFTSSAPSFNAICISHQKSLKPFVE